MGRLLSLAVALVFGLALVTAASAGPRDEKEHLTKADTAVARRGLLKRSDLAPGWNAVRVPPDSSGPRCRNYNPDFSRFTITGKAASGFTRTAGIAIASGIEVYPNVAQATGDFQTGARPAFVACFASKLLRQFRQSGVAASIASKSASSSPRIGLRSMTFHIVFKLKVQGQSVKYYVDLFAFQVGRTQGSVSFQSLGRQIPRQTALARLVAKRLS